MQFSIECISARTNSPDGDDFQGTTPFQFWSLPFLQENEDYYWRIDVEDSNGTTTGPVWHFETENDIIEGGALDGSGTSR